MAYQFAAKQGKQVLQKPAVNNLARKQVLHNKLREQVLRPDSWVAFIHKKYGFDPGKEKGMAMDICQRYHALYQETEQCIQDSKWEEAAQCITALMAMQPFRLHRLLMPMRQHRRAMLQASAATVPYEPMRGHDSKLNMMDPTNEEQDQPEHHEGNPT